MALTGVSDYKPALGKIIDDPHKRSEMLALPVSRLAAPVRGTNTKGKYLNLLNKFVDDAWSIQGLDGTCL
jgi:hypothetical protein